MSALTGKSLSDDLTGAAALQPHPCVAPRGPSRDSSTQSDEAPQEPELPAQPDKLKTEPDAVSAATTGGFNVHALLFKVEQGHERLLQIANAVIFASGCFSNLLSNFILAVDTSEEPKALLKTSKSINSADAEVVEILIWELAEARITQTVTAKRWRTLLAEVLTAFLPCLTTIKKKAESRMWHSRERRAELSLLLLLHNSQTLTFYLTSQNPSRYLDSILHCDRNWAAVCAYT